MTVQNPQGAMQGPDALFVLQQTSAAQQAITQALTNVSQIPGGQLTAALIGDSLTAKNNANGTVNSISWTPGVITVTVSLGHNMIAGQFMRYVANSGGSSVPLNGVYQIQSIVSTTVFTATGQNAIGTGTDASGGVFVDLQQVANTGWLSWANLFSGQKFNVIWNSGVGGDTTAGMLARAPQEIIPLKPQLCFIMGGVNDSASATSTTTTTVATTAAANLLAIANLCIANGIIPVLLTTLPVASGLGSAAIRQAVINQINNILKNAAAKNSNLILIDVATAIMAPATGFMIPSCVSSDGTNIHLSAIGARLCGQMIADSFARTKYGYLLTASALDSFTGAAAASNSSQNLLDNAPWVATGGVVGAGCSGTAAQGFNVLRTAGAGTAVSSAPARNMIDDGDNIGFNQRLAFTSGGATDIFDMRINQGTDTAMQNRMVVGGWYELRGAMRLQNVQGSGFKNFAITFLINMTDPITGFAYTYSFNPFRVIEATTYDQAFPIGYCTTPDITIVFRSLPIQVPTTITGSNGTGVRFTFNFAAAATAGNPPLTADVGRVSFVRVA